MDSIQSSLSFETPNFIILLFGNHDKAHILTNAWVLFQWLALFFDPNKPYTSTLLLSNIANYARRLHWNELEAQNIVTQQSQVPAEEYYSETA